MTDPFPAEALAPAMAAQTQAMPPSDGKVEALGHRAARGFTWYLAQIIGVKVVNVTGQVVLSWLLLTRDYGFIGLAFTVATFVALLQQAGVREVLVQRGKHFERWSGAAFWISLLAGLLGAVLMLAAAPLASWFFREPLLAPMIMLLAISGFMNALGAVPDAKMQVDMRFRLMASLSFTVACVSMILSIVLAALGFGAYSVVLPIVIGSVLRNVTSWFIVRPTVRLRVQPQRVKYLLKDNLTLLAATLCLMVTWQGDYAILGRMYSPEVVGLYFWAFGLSLQTLYLLAESMTGVLFPSLSKLNEEPQRQRAAFLRAARSLALGGLGGCAAQAVLAAPMVHLLFKPQWFDGIRIIELLSVGMALQVIGTPAYAALKAQGRFRFVLVLSAAYAALFLVLVYIGARYGAALGAAAGVAVYSSISSVITTYSVLRDGRRWRDILSIYAAPVLAAALAVAASYGAAAFLPRGSKGQWAMVALVSGTVLLAVYLPLVRWLARDTWEEMAQRVRHMLGRPSVESAAALVANG